MQMCVQSGCVLEKCHREYRGHDRRFSGVGHGHKVARLIGCSDNGKSISHFIDPDSSTIF
jgi:hypothetical protein